MESKIRSAVDEAEQAFWAVIASNFPEIKTGDLDPLTAFKLAQTMSDTVKIWLDTNKGA